MGENVRIARLDALDGGKGRHRRCFVREALRDKVGEGMRCLETKHYFGENVRIVRLVVLDGGRGLISAQKVLF